MTLRLRPTLVGLGLTCGLGAAWLGQLPVLSRLALLPLGPARLTLEERGPTVIQRIQALCRLETVAYNEHQCLEGRTQWAHVPTWLVGDRLSFFAQGEVVAGLDLSTLCPKTVRLKGNRAIVALPAPDIFAVRLDNRASQVYARSTGLFSSADPQLETTVRQRAEEVLRTSALQEWILDQARAHATEEIDRLLRSLGADEVTFVRS